MSIDKYLLPNRPSLLARTPRRKYIAIFLLAALGLAGCAGGNSPGEVTYGALFQGVAVADEPQAATVGARMLKLGGSAVDAAVATYFALAVTYPSAAGFGGGGVCLINDRLTGEVMSLDFLAPRPARIDGGFQATAVPANVRGMAALHARYGDLDWRVVLAPAEKMARFGYPVSRAAAGEFAAGRRAIAGDPEAWRIFAVGNRLPREGDKLIQADLADTIGRLRIDGAVAMYSGAFSHQFANAVRQAGGTLTADDLRNFVPRWQVAPSIDFGNDKAYFAPPPAGAGLVAAQMWRMLTDSNRYRRADSVERLHLLAETARRGFEGRALWLADDGTTVDMAGLISRERGRQAMADYDSQSAGPPGAGDDPAKRQSAGTGFVTLDVTGTAVACTFTMYRGFGAGAVAPGTGVLLAPAPDAGQRNPLSLGPMIVYNPRVRSFKFAAVGGGGPAGPTAMINVAMETLARKGGNLDQAIAAPRLHAPASEGAVIVERSIGGKSVKALAARGQTVRKAADFGRVNAVYCRYGYPVEPTKVECRAAADPRGKGLAAVPR
jgi:gamma-glutamyltranspeptidase/glutathione hydrolase